MRYVKAAAGHPSWMLYRLAGRLRHLQHLTLQGYGVEDTPILPALLANLAETPAGQQQQQERGWDWGDLAAPGLGGTNSFNAVVVPPPNMGALSALQTLDFHHSHYFRCCGPHHWHALAGCQALQQLHGLEAWQVPPAGVKFPGVTRLKILVATPLGDLVTVLGAFPALQQLRLSQQLTAPATQQVGCCCSVGLLAFGTSHHWHPDWGLPTHLAPCPYAARLCYSAGSCVLGVGGCNVCCDAADRQRAAVVPLLS
jgi:hypothetical protein